MSETWGPVQAGGYQIGNANSTQMEEPTVTEQPDVIEHKCWCGGCVWDEDCCYWHCLGSVIGQPSSLETGDVKDDFPLDSGHCPRCGCDLDKNGFAYRMVRADECWITQAQRSGCGSGVEDLYEDLAAEGSEDDENL